jgi:hypothetical protein
MNDSVFGAGRSPANPWVSAWHDGCYLVSPKEPKEDLMRYSFILAGAVALLFAVGGASAFAADSDAPAAKKANSHRSTDHAVPSTDTLPTHASATAKANAFGQQGARERAERAAHAAARAAAVDAAKDAADADAKADAAAHGKAHASTHAPASQAQAGQATAAAAHAANAARAAHR